MKRFTQYITEAKLTHLDHVEDAIFNQGLEGGAAALKILDDVSATLSGSSKRAVNIQAKVDGAPAIIAGTDPENGKFFVATKALFNKTPKINYTNADIDANHTGGLADKLKIALKEFPKMKMKGIFQGDFMFTPGDLKSETIDGEKYITFTPNTITYAVPVGSELEKTISKSKAGVIWHTTYTGDTIADLSANFNISLSNFTKQASVWFTDTTFRNVSGSASFTKAESAKFEAKLERARKELKLLDRKSMSLLFGGTEMGANLNIYINHLTKNGKKFAGRQQAIGGFIDFLRGRYGPMIDKLKSEKGKAKKQKVLDDLIDTIRQRKVGGTLAHAFQWHDDVNSMKLDIVKKLETVNSIPAFIKTPTGYKTTGPEGFVAIDTLSNSAVKLVNRLEFSRNNFNAIKAWD